MQVYRKNWFNWNFVERRMRLNEGHESQATSPNLQQNALAACSQWHETKSRPTKIQVLTKTIILILFLTCFILESCDLNSSKRQTKESSILFNDITVIDAKAGERKNFNVLVTGNKIVQVTNEAIESPPNCAIVDGRGKFLIPGLWDFHVHLTFTPGLEQSMFPLFLANGITSIRDTGGLIDLVGPLRDKSRSEPNSSPRVFISGPLMDGLPNVYDGSYGRPEISVGLGSSEEATAMVDTLNAVGVDLIKSYEMLSPELFTTIIKRAKKHGLAVTGHVPLSMDVVEASNAGLRSMEHLRNMEMSCSADFDSLLQARKKMLADGKDSLGSKLRSQIHAAQRMHAIRSFDEKRAAFVLERLAANNTWQTPTAALVSGGVNRLYENEKWRETFEFLPSKIRSQWISRANSAQQRESSEISLVHAQWALMMVQKLKDADVKILAGTDTPIGFMTPGFSLHKELEMLVKGGLKPIEALESATLLPAKYFGLEDQMGTISPNMAADLILLEANPLTQIENTRKINAVVRNGFYYDRKALDSLLIVSSHR